MQQNKPSCETPYVILLKLYSIQEQNELVQT